LNEERADAQPNRRTRGRRALLYPPRNLPTTDGLIAATALEHRLTVVTRNPEDFDRSGVNALNPF